jgi:hypothetical protein
MLQRRLPALLLAAVVTFAACGSASDTDTDAASASIDGDVVAVGAAPAPAPPGDGVGSLGDAVEVAAGAPGQATDAACPIDRQTIETALEAYEILNGALPTSQQDLLDAQLIRELSVRYEITAEGAIVPAPGSPCA